MSNNRKITGQKLAGLSKGKTSRWHVDAEYRRENSGWLKMSAFFAIQVIDRMDELNINQSQLAEILKVSPQQVSKVLAGTENLTLETHYKYEQALDFSIETSINKIPHYCRRNYSISERIGYVYAIAQMHATPNSILHAARLSSQCAYSLRKPENIALKDLLKSAQV